MSTSVESFSVWGRLLPYLKGPGIILVFAPVDRMVRISGVEKNTTLVFPMPVDISHIEAQREGIMAAL